MNTFYLANVGLKVHRTDDEKNIQNGAKLKGKKLYK